MARKKKLCPEGYDLNKTNAQIMSELGVGGAVIARWRREAGVMKNRGRKDLKPPEGYDLTKPGSVIAMQCGVSHHTALKWKYAAGIAPSKRGRQLAWDEVDLDSPVYGTPAPIEDHGWTEDHGEVPYNDYWDCGRMVPRKYPFDHDYVQQY